MPVTIRPYQPADAAAISTLFYDTVRTVNLGDYTQEQVDAWAGVIMPDSAAHWHQRLAALTTFVATGDDQIVGFADVRDDGYLDHLFVHHLRQRRGIATLLHHAIEAEARRRSVAKLFTHASITARPFFCRVGYVEEREQTVVIRGVALTNFVMSKSLR